MARRSELLRFGGRLGAGDPTAPELGDRELRLAQAGVTRGVEAEPLLVKLDALLQAGAAALEALHDLLERGDELVERPAGELLVGEDLEAGVVDHESSSSVPSARVRSTRVSTLPRATITCSASPGCASVASRRIRPSGVRATA